jgi:hypothetical protein
MDRRELLRRGLRVTAAGSLAALAGCTTDGGDGEAGAGNTTPTATSVPDGATPGTGATPTPTATGGGMDLREANVTGVAVARESGRTFRFDVTLYHDDDGEDGYANWWQVETRDGERLGRRELLHAHGTREFTRSESTEVPGRVDCVVVRGHDQDHGYGGRAALVALPTGAVRFVDQGPEPRSMAGDACP